jgi:bacillithiol system protein YtxJ
MASHRYFKIDSEAVFEQAAELSMQEPVVLFKHSTMCGSSFRARRQMEELAGADGPPVYEVVIQETRALSALIATELGVRHQSPQVIVLYQRQPVFDTSHRAITAEAVRDAISRVSAV